MALRMSSPASSGSTISPLRTPRDRDWPTPMMPRAPEAFTSPTTAHTFDVPISRPTMTEDGSNIFLFGGWRPPGFGCAGRNGAGLQPEHGHIVGHGKIERQNRPAPGTAVIVHRPPPPELLIDPSHAEGDLASLTGGDDQLIRRGKIDGLEIHHSGQGRGVELRNEFEGRQHSRSIRDPARDQFDAREAVQNRQI